ncbi:unnamed protein product [Calypogeia fissa]
MGKLKQAKDAAVGLYHHELRNQQSLRELTQQIQAQMQSIRGLSEQVGELVANKGNVGDLKGEINELKGQINVYESQARLGAVTWSLGKWKSLAPTNAPLSVSELSMACREVAEQVEATYCPLLECAQMDKAKLVVAENELTTCECK